MKNDDNSTVKLTATNIFKIFISNTPRCLKIIYNDFIDCILNLYKRNNEHYTEVADFGLKEFAYKYGDNFIHGILGNLEVLKN